MLEPDDAQSLLEISSIDIKLVLSLPSLNLVLCFLAMEDAMERVSQWP